MIQDGVMVIRPKNKSHDFHQTSLVPSNVSSNHDPLPPVKVALQQYTHTGVSSTWDDENLEAVERIKWDFGSNTFMSVPVTGVARLRSLEPHEEPSIGNMVLRGSEWIPAVEYGDGSYSDLLNATLASQQSDRECSCLRFLACFLLTLLPLSRRRSLSVSSC